MKKTGILVLALILAITFKPVFSQNKKFDKSLQKIDSYFASGSLSKANSSLQKLKKSVTTKMGQQNAYMPGLYLREARISLALGVLAGFDNALTNALTSSQAMYGDNSTSYANTLIDVAEIYNDYGNYRISREYLAKAKDLLSKTNQMTDALNGKIALAEAEAMIGQGFCNDALSILESVDKYFISRAIEKESISDGTSIKTQRVPIEEIPQRYNDYARLLNLRLKAYTKKGRISIIGGDTETADNAYSAVRSWLKGKSRFLGETSLAEVEARYIFAKALEENGTRHENDLDFDNILSDLKKKVNPTNSIAHDIYLDYLEVLLKRDNRARYLNTKLEYEKVLDKSFPKTSIHRENEQAVEFTSKMSRDKTKNLEAQALDVLKKLPKNYITSARTVEFLYDVSLREKRYTAAESYLNQLTEIKKELYGENSPEYHLAKIYLADFYLDYTNKIDEAGKIYKESYFGIVEKQIGEQHKNLLNILNHIATWYELTDQYDLALKTLNDASDKAILKYSNEDPEYGKELDRIAGLALKIGKYEKAEADITKALKILEEYRKDETRTEDYVHAIDTQAKLYGIKGMFDEAEANLDRSSRLIAKAKGEVASELSTGEELTALFIQLGGFFEADNLLKIQIPEYEKLYGKNSLRLIEPLVNKGRILLAKGDYTEAERTAQRANQIAVKTYGEMSTKTAPTQKLLSDIYYTLGDYDKAQDNVVKAINSQEKQFGRNHIEVAKSISQLALIKFYKGDNRKEVEKLMIESRDIMASKLGKENPQYAEILKNVAVLYISEKKFDIAFNSLTVAENIWRMKTGKKNNINTASIYTLTGDVYYQQKNYKKAEEFYTKSKDLYEQFFSSSHPEYVKVLSKLSKVYYMQKDYKRSKKLIEEALTDYELFIKDFFPALSEREKAKYWNTIKGDFEFYNTLAFSNLEDFRDLSGKVYNYQLLTKALLLSSSIKIRERILNSTDEQLKSQYSTWLQKKEQLTLALSLSPAQLLENQIDPSALQQEVERLEKDLSQKSELFGQSFDNKRISFEDVKKVLKPNDVAIEMVRYRYFNHTLTDSVIYAALYIKKDFSRPKVIMLKDGKKMETRFFKFYRNAITGKIPDTYSYNVFWEPIVKEIGQVATVYLSADGVYNQINLESIPTPDGRYIIDNSNIVLVSNTKDLYLRNIKTRASTSENTATMFGNPTFYMTASSDQNIAPLPGTEKEVTQVQFMLKQKGWLTAEYVEKLASEEKIKEMSSPKIFHIATHGFYRPTIQASAEQQIEGNEAMMAQNPLMRTGLLLKGAGDLMDKTSYNFNMENGILTAYEAMSLNLDKTDLVVLSACETGLGDLEAGEGVYGLQRAFLVAGAKVLIMSMFKVDDEATQQLMLKFYQKWLNSGNLRQSFIDAKKELRTDYPEPIYWGAFMMIGLD
ncbi:CHAT domain-containing protein [Ohtaekwangia koreensis]|uniref:Tetratricopeptide repeat-containing protein n=1 Tax=Ohtaekwangia koreensis TaxID=688867 RepID=A0A1T5JDG6_9BACT|nr:CHAT domain-containing protein [Ohtaekwangia koreensis]SKC49617.1 Tetratricopeptide repeat-containing protein [Ohtaekwangia koreensis]